MKYSFLGASEKSIKESLFFHNMEGIKAHELLEVNIRATGERAQEIIEIAEKATEAFLDDVKEMLENGDSKESPQ